MPHSDIKKKEKKHIYPKASRLVSHVKSASYEQQQMGGGSFTFADDSLVPTQVDCNKY